MNNIVNKKTIFSGMMLIIFFNTIVYCQGVIEKDKTSADSLSLRSVIQKVISNYPSVKVAEEAIRNADSKIALAKTGYNPVVDITASFANLAPVTNLSFPGLGTFQLYPANNYSASVNYEQLVYDFGRTHQNVEIENENKIIGEQALAQTKQKLSLFTVNNFYALVYLQSAIKIKDEQLSTLNEHLQYIEKMMATGSETEYQLLSTKVRISTVESQKVDIVAALTSQQSSMNSLTGNSQGSNDVYKSELSVEPPVIPSDSVPVSYTHLTLPT